MRIDLLNMTDQELIEADLALKWSVRLGLVSDTSAALMVAILGAEKARRVKERERTHVPDPIILGFTAGMLIIDQVDE